MRTLVPLKVKIGLHDRDDGNGHKAGHAKYPNFNLIASSIRKGMDWSQYIDTFGIGLHYDKTCGHKEESVDSPQGEQMACMCVPSDFADAAVAAFPGEVSIIPEAELETFYNDKAHAHEPEELVDSDVLQAIAAKEAVGAEVPEKTDALNPLSDARGIRKNTNKKWADFKTKAGVSIA